MQEEQVDEDGLDKSERHDDDERERESENGAAGYYDDERRKWSENAVAERHVAEALFEPESADRHQFAVPERGRRRVSRAAITTVHAERHSAAQRERRLHVALWHVSERHAVADRPALHAAERHSAE